MKNIFFTASNKMADLIHANYHLLPVIERFGIPLGFGEKTVSQVCLSRNVDENLFLMVCNVYSNAAYVPSGKTVTSFPISALTDYLLESHRYYLEDRIPHIGRHLSDMVKSYPRDKADIMTGFFNQYRHEVSEHLEYEEKTVFPYIKALDNGNRKTDYSISRFEKNHTDIQEKLVDLQNIIIKYLPCPEGSCQQNEILYDLFHLDEDLGRHTLIEDKILVPLVNELEKKAEK